MGRIALAVPDVPGIVERLLVFLDSGCDAVVAEALVQVRWGCVLFLHGLLYFHFFFVLSYFHPIAEALVQAGPHVLPGFPFCLLFRARLTVWWWMFVLLYYLLACG